MHVMTSEVIACVSLGRMVSAYSMNHEENAP